VPHHKKGVQVERHGPNIVAVVVEQTTRRKKKPRSYHPVTGLRLIFSLPWRETLLAGFRREIPMADLVSGTVILALFLWAVLRKPTPLPEDIEQAR
jgi:hypothetical protein